ncbi:ribonuclease H-like domain-containing protein [Fomitopsis serialis]|uniref:ribonuclease H-like domain-containing protein n=1 Tax=Fomitopsis serialis TaxID=139415 RepID=UPI0020083C06|nr:ribonuclease H-like domain-containing protein [Neoantrodia serialis]KAH9934887.1 ribonuclease H-like domain-containing protein [Neoantrodia serialis]
MFSISRYMWTGTVQDYILLGLTVVLLLCVRSIRRRWWSCEGNLSSNADVRSLREPPEITVLEDQESRQRAKQLYDAFLVLDVEGTCEGTKSFDYPNEIIEMCLLRWKDKDDEGLAECLEVVSEFRSFVKPTWRPQLSEFCTQLTGITQEQVDSAPTFTELVDSFREFLEANGLIDPDTGRRLVKFCWCSDGPYDIRDFVVKQCFISKVPMPAWITGDVLDIRKAVHILLDAVLDKRSAIGEQSGQQHAFPISRRVALTIPRQLASLSLAPFQGRQHSGIDDARNIARILTELPRRGVKLEPNMHVNPRKRWPWMGKRGKVLEDYI